EFRRVLFRSARRASSPGGPAIPPALSCGCNARADTSRGGLPEHSCSRYELSSQALPLSETNDGLDRAAIFAIFGSLIDLIEPVKLDQFLEREAPLGVELDELGDKNVGYALTLENAADPLTRYHQVVHVKAHL